MVEIRRYGDRLMLPQGASVRGNGLYYRTHRHSSATVARARHPGVHGQAGSMRHLYEIHTSPQPPLIADVLSGEIVAELARLREFL